MPKVKVMDTEYTRKRVAKACQRCRSMKTKCDGERPECGRCKGYGYTCVYRLQRPRQRTRPQRFSDDLADQLPDLCEAMVQQETLLEHVLSMLPSGSKKKSALSKHSLVKSQLDQAVTAIKDEIITRAATIGTESVGASPSNPVDPVDTTPGYLGEVSDICFVNLVKRFLQPRDSASITQADFESYDQGEGALCSGAVASNVPPLPALEDVEQLINAYFSTIHVAYPFIPETRFKENYVKLRDQEIAQSSSKLNATETALTYTICAIGSYYTSIAKNMEEGEDLLHEKYFSYSLALAPTTNIERSTTRVSLLLARCFYLLVVCRTESCWTILGKAVRVAQSIGMHVESINLESSHVRSSLEVEHRRRIWYSLYVLDRLLSLQLGRPPAIHDDDFNVPLPSRASDSDIDWESEALQEPSTNVLSAGDYFLAVISFSEIVGRVLRGLYCPKRRHVASEDLANTKNLDRQLQEWKLSLPRVLRFDLGHTFEQSFVFNRQRNMLAIKYHHLRALIYRPYLCHFLLVHDPAASLTEVNWALISAYERTCITEARETARLLYGISSTEDLVHNFPWWQMISCLVCASSILLVSSIFALNNQEGSSDFDTQGLLDDAETCLKVFDALSADSPGARIARDMMKALKECGARWKDERESLTALSDYQAALPPLTTMTTPMSSDDPIQPLSAFGAQNPATSLYWPAEIVDSMAWSAQFFDVGQIKINATENRPQAASDGEIE